MIEDLHIWNNSKLSYRTTRTLGHRSKRHDLQMPNNTVDVTEGTHVVMEKVDKRDAPF